MLLPFREDLSAVIHTTCRANSVSSLIFAAVRALLKLGSLHFQTFERLLSLLADETLLFGTAILALLMLK